MRGGNLGGRREEHCDLKALSSGKQLRPNSSMLRKFFVK